MARTTTPWSWTNSSTTISSSPMPAPSSNIGGHEPTDFADLDGDAVDESFIGRKWLVVVDYHN